MSDSRIDVFATSIRFLQLISSRYESDDLLDEEIQSFVDLLAFSLVPFIEDGYHCKGTSEVKASQILAAVFACVAAIISALDANSHASLSKMGSVAAVRKRAIHAFVPHVNGTELLAPEAALLSLSHIVRLDARRCISSAEDTSDDSNGKVVRNTLSTSTTACVQDLLPHLLLGPLARHIAIRKALLTLLASLATLPELAVPTSTSDESGSSSLASSTERRVDMRFATVCGDILQPLLYASSSASSFTVPSSGAAARDALVALSLVYQCNPFAGKTIILQKIKRVSTQQNEETTLLEAVVEHALGDSDCRFHVRHFALKKYDLVVRLSE